jgi:hypothetical protein
MVKNRPSAFSSWPLALILGSLALVFDGVAGKWQSEKIICPQHSDSSSSPASLD